MKQKWTANDMPSLTGKVILITGANSGIGYRSAVEFARHGARVLLGCRNLQKGQQALNNLRQEVPEAQAEVAHIDVSSLASVRHFAEAFLQTGSQLDVLVNNAGVMALKVREVTDDKHERQFATNHLGHFALTGLLLKSLNAATAARVVTVASLAHRNGRMEWDNLHGERRYEGWDAYNRSKLANILFARELERRARLQNLSLLSIPVHPGVSRTSIFENGPGTKSIKSLILRVFAPVLTQDDTMGALPTEFAATAPEARGGEYIGPDGFGELRGYPVTVNPRPHALDAAAGERLWSISEELTGVSFLS